MLILKLLSGMLFFYQRRVLFYIQQIDVLLMMFQIK